MFNQNQSVMKKRVLLLVAFLALLLVPVFSQTVPASWQDLYENYGVFLATYLGIAGVAMFLGEFVIRLLKLTTKFTKVVAVWVLAVGVSFLGMAINVGYLAEATWWETLMWGMLSGVAANGLFGANIAFLKTAVEFIIGLIKAKEPKT